MTAVALGPSQQHWYFPIGKRPISVTVRRLNAASDAVAEGSLLDISCSVPPMSSFGGIRMVSPAILRFEEEVEVSLYGNTSDIEDYLQAKAVVRAIRPAEADSRWQIGCAFRHEVSLDRFETWVARGILSRRSHVRQPVILAASAVWEGRTRPTQVDLIDIGYGGFCLESAAPAQIGCRVHVAVQEKQCPLELKGEVRWTSNTNGKHQIGCMFTGRNMTQAVNKILDFYGSIVAEK